MSKLRVDILTKRILLGRVYGLKAVIPSNAFLELCQVFEEVLSKDLVDTEDISKILIMLDSIEGDLKVFKCSAQDKQEARKYKKKETHEGNKKIIQVGLLSNQTSFLYSGELMKIKRDLLKLTKENETHHGGSKHEMKRF